LIRHAHAAWAPDENRSLSDSGLKAAALVADRLASRPIAAIYTSPSRRSVQTVEPLAMRLNLHLEHVPDLRERELPMVPHDEFAALVRRSWSAPDVAPEGGESNVRAQARGLAVLRTVLARHTGSEVVVATHGNLLALVMNALDSRFGYDWWQGLSFPDIYRLVFDGSELRGVERLWDTA
jgi:2,3-bisphosphoglycerate-dependent phosphoglycerate mutase